MAVNDQINACGFDGFGNGRFDNIHVSHALFALFGLGLRSGLFGNGQSFLNRLHEHHGLPARIVSESAELLISHIAQAPLVAVREQSFAAANISDDGVADQFGARGAGKCGAQHDVTVAGHHNDASTGSGVELKQRDHRLCFRMCVVADPVVKKVAQNNELRVARRNGLHEAYEGHDGFGLRRGKMKVGNDDRVR